jgi:putative peptide zinc metalloprotease protein
LLEPGLARDVATAVVVIGGVSSLVVNGNPLLRFDGYHVMCDLLELPNLAQRSTRYWLQLLRRQVLNLRASRFGALARGEAGWLFAYAPLSWLLRIALVGLIAAALVDKVPAIGFTVLLLGLWMFVVAPLGKVLGWLLRTEELQGRRTRALAVVFGLIACVGALAFGVQLPSRSHAPGLVWLPDEALVRLQVDGFVEEFYVRDGQPVKSGTPLLRLSNDQLLTALAKAEAELEQQRIERVNQFGRDALATAKADDRIARLEGEVAALTGQRDALVVRAASAGRVAIDMQRTLPGMHLPQGQLVAHVVPDGAPLVRALVSNDDVGFVQQQGGEAIVSLPQGGPEIVARQERLVPQATSKLPSAALGNAGGGSIALDPTDQSGLTAREPHFQVDLRLPADARAPIGARVLVTFEHGEATVADLLASALRRGFLRHFDT